MHYSFTTVLGNLASALTCLRVEEVPVSYRRRIGCSKISGTAQGATLAALKISWTILRLRFVK